MFVFLALMAESLGPVESLCEANRFKIENSGTHANAGDLFLTARHDLGHSAFTILSNSNVVDARSEFFQIVDSPGFDLATYGGTDRVFKASDYAPIGIASDIPKELFIVRSRRIDSSKPVQTCLVVVDQMPRVWLVGNYVNTRTKWDVIGYNGRSAHFGKEDKEEFDGCMMALARWHNSEATAKLGFVDNTQRVAGREMVTKVDKNQNVYVDMNELSRHRGWNFTISLEPARADVRIGDDHIRIYPGADRIHINDELVTLPGTVPTQGYGVYLPLRLLQERGYLPSTN